MVVTVIQEGGGDKGDQVGPWHRRDESLMLSPCSVCSVRSVDGSPTTAFTVLECEGSRRLGSRPRRYLLTGQANGRLAMWDLTTAMDGLGQAPGTPGHPLPAPDAAPHKTQILTFGLISPPNPLPSDPFSRPPTPPCPTFPAALCFFQPWVLDYGPLTHHHCLGLTLLSYPLAGGLTEEELMKQLEQCELAPLASSRSSLPSPSPQASLTR